MWHQYLVILRGSSTDVTALKELGMGTTRETFSHISTQHWPQFDQVGISFSTQLNQIGLLANLLTRGKIIWFQEVR